MTKPKRDTIIANLKDRIEDLEDLLRQERRKSDLLQDELAFERMSQHARVQRNQWVQ